jgi:hypothetical protein
MNDNKFVINLQYITIRWTSMSVLKLYQLNVWGKVIHTERRSQ